MVIEFWTDIMTGINYAVVSDEPQIMVTTLTELA